MPLVTSNLLPCSITLFPGRARISCPAPQHQTGTARRQEFVPSANVAGPALETGGTTRLAPWSNDSASPNRAINHSPKRLKDPSHVVE
ncbi:hypothetical protein QYF61_002736 [Mycteria americana]|uniref:Uncharacterized protein n=1 Tax=Mycteria americana TaxID=33587 RepID=A0AAN7RS15_MYCAM|nr:hypothetical protein QYF61_002736 [Mycteria americana]